MHDDFDEALAAAAERCERMHERSGLLSEAHYYAHRMSAAHRREAAAAKRAQEEDRAMLGRFVAWALEHHREALLAFGEGLAELEVTPSYGEGWAQTLGRWRAGDGAVGEPGGPPALWWLITLGRQHRPATSAK